MLHETTAAELRQQQAEKAINRWVPARYRAAQVDRPEVAMWVAATLDGATESLLIVGGLGTGKTHQAYAAAREVLLAKARAGRRCSFAAVTHAGLNDEVRPGGAGLDPYMSADLLVLDDLGAAHVTSWNADAAYRLIDHRWSNLMPTIFTSNFSAAELGGTLGERLSSRLFGMSRRVAMTGADRRRA